jgi:hypothetical protein
MQSLERFENMGVNRKLEGEGLADFEPGEVDGATVSGGGLHRVHHALEASAFGPPRTEFSTENADFTPAEKSWIEDFHDDGGLPRGIA